MEAYLDNSATTRCTEGVRDVVVRTMMEDYGNPSSKHMKGVEAERYLRDARETIAKTLKVNEKEIYFTSGATESNNWALIGAAMANRRAGMHLITTAVEHAAVLMPMQYLKEQGFRITYLPVDEKGKISLKDLLPDNVKLTSDSSEDVWVTVSILPEGSREFTLSTKDIEVKNKPDDLQVTFETAQIEIRIKSDTEDLDDLNTETDIKASIDLKGKEEGNYKVPVTLSLPDGYETVENVSTEVVISSGTGTDDSKG